MRGIYERRHAIADDRRVSQWMGTMEGNHDLRSGTVISVLGDKGEHS